ncbi:MAG: hypothetical protein SFV54_27630 [Bryobacteraceae bacterium]|nr:hypothetical protein [Bryobacteraceae bacterium]
MAATKPKRNTSQGNARRAGAAARGSERHGAAAKKSGGDSGTKALDVRGEGKRFLTKFKSELSPSTLRAKFINEPEEHADRPGQPLATRNIEVVKRWAEERGAVPTTVRTRQSGNQVRTLRFIFPASESRGRLEEIEWEEFAEPFNGRKLVFLFQEQMRVGRQSNFFRFDNPTREEG